MSKTITTSISEKMWELAREHQLTWSDALEVGIRRLTIDRDLLHDRVMELQGKLDGIEKRMTNMNGRLAMMEEPIMQELKRKLSL